LGGSFSNSAQWLGSNDPAAEDDALFREVPGGVRGNGRAEFLYSENRVVFGTKFLLIFPDRGRLGWSTIRDKSDSTFG
jgi:hypothetical protein